MRVRPHKAGLTIGDPAPDGAAKLAANAGKRTHAVGAGALAFVGGAFHF